MSEKERFKLPWLDPLYVKMRTYGYLLISFFCCLRIVLLFDNLGALKCAGSTFRKFGLARGLEKG